MFYTYNQNNSGGVFKVDRMLGIAHYVIVEAASAAEADDRFEAIGGYFDGCQNDIDCDCCGDRWSRAWDDDGAAVPLVWGDEPSQHVGGAFRECVAIHPLEGAMQWLEPA